MGASVVSGAITTVVAAVMLIFCTIQIFSKFGQIVSFNIASSVVFTLFLFSALLMIAGPVQNVGRIVTFFSMMWRPVHNWLKPFLGKFEPLLKKFRKNKYNQVYTFD